MSLNVIDWDRFFENGSPFYDIAQVVYHVLTPNSCVDEFITNVRSMEKNSAIQIIDNLLSEHFQNKINLIRINIFPDGGISRIRVFGKTE